MTINETDLFVEPNPNRFEGGTARGPDVDAAVAAAAGMASFRQAGYVLVRYRKQGGEFLAVRPDEIFPASKDGWQVLYCITMGLPR